MTAPVCLQIAALGGQGGGVLAEWLSAAAEIAGYPAQITSIPGVAQRTGATTYYLELLPDRNPPARPVFSLFPDSDGLDVMAALEPMEAGRALELGLITARTTVITASERIYSTAEKSIAGDGAVPAAAILERLEDAAKSVIRIDVDALTGKAGAPGNGVLFGAIAATGILPLEPGQCREAIKETGVAVSANLGDFQSGLGAAGAPAVLADRNLVHDPCPPELESELDAVPAGLRDLVGHGLARLADYQDADYAQHFLRRLEPFLGGDETVCREVVQRLAAWMSYEDVIRVAQLKTRPGRIARIRGELGVDHATPLTVTDFLKPGREELASLLPPGWGRRVMAGAMRSPRGGIRLRIPVTSAWGFAMMRLLAALRPWRRRSFRFAEEQAAIESWLDAVVVAAETDSGLAIRTAELAALARGYGDVRRRGLARLEATFADWKTRVGADASGLSRELDELLRTAREDPDRDAANQD